MTDENAKLRELLSEAHKLMLGEALEHSKYMPAWIALDKEMAELGFFPHRVKK